MVQTTGSAFSRASIVESVLEEDVLCALDLPDDVVQSLASQDTGSYALKPFSCANTPSGWSLDVKTEDSTLQWHWRDPTPSDETTTAAGVDQTSEDLKPARDSVLSIRLDLHTCRVYRSTEATAKAVGGSKLKRKPRISWELAVWINEIEKEVTGTEEAPRLEAPVLLSMLKDSLGLEPFVPSSTDTFQIRCAQLGWKDHHLAEIVASSLHRQGGNLATVGKCAILVGDNAFGMTGTFLQLALTHSIFVHWGNVSHIHFALPSSMSTSAVWSLASPMKRVKLHLNEDMVKCTLPMCTWKPHIPPDTKPAASADKPPSILAEHLNLTLEIEKAIFVWDDGEALEWEGFQGTLEPITEKHKIVPHFSRSRIQLQAKQVSIPSLLEIAEVNLNSILETSRDTGLLTALHVMEIAVQEMIVDGYSDAFNKLRAFLELLKDKDHWSRPIGLAYAKVSSCTCYYYMDTDMPRLVVGKTDEALADYDSSVDSTVASLLTHYVTRFCRDIDIRNSRVSRTREAVGDTVAASLGRMALTGAAITTPVGLAASMAAVGVKDGVRSLAQTGKAVRGDDTYQFGDVTRGVVASVRRTFADKDDQPASEECDTPTGDSPGAATEGNKESYMSRNKGKYAGLLGSSMGAVAGMAIAGPIGMVAGSFAASSAARSYAEGPQNEVGSSRELSDPDVTVDDTAFEPVRRSTTEGSSMSASTSDAGDAVAPLNAPPSQGSNLDIQTRSARTPSYVGAQHDSELQETTEERPYRFGDGLKSIVARGKAADGRNQKSGYKFGDFTRGLFS